MHNDCATASMGIINGKNLLHDMQIFKNKVNEFFQLLQIEHTANINKEIGHALVHYAIIFMIRTCRFVTYKNMKTIHDEFKKVLNSKIFKESLKYYYYEVYQFWLEKKSLMYPEVFSSLSRYLSVHTLKYRDGDPFITTMICATFFDFYSVKNLRKMLPDNKKRILNGLIYMHKKIKYLMRNIKTK